MRNAVRGPCSRLHLLMLTCIFLGVSTARLCAAGGTLKATMSNDLKYVDPFWTTAYVTRNYGLRSPRRPLVVTQHDGGTCSHFFFRSLHDYRKIPTYFARFSQMARGEMV